MCAIYCVFYFKLAYETGVFFFLLKCYTHSSCICYILCVCVYSCASHKGDQHGNDVLTNRVEGALIILRVL